MLRCSAGCRPPPCAHLRLPSCTRHAWLARSAKCDLTARVAATCNLPALLISNTPSPPPSQPPRRMLIFFSFYVFHAPVTRLNLFGYAFCCTGVGVYNYQKLQVGAACDACWVVTAGRATHAAAACGEGGADDVVVPPLTKEPWTGSIKQRAAFLLCPAWFALNGAMLTFGCSYALLLGPAAAQKEGAAEAEGGRQQRQGRYGGRAAAAGKRRRQWEDRGQQGLKRLSGPPRACTPHCRPQFLAAPTTDCLLALNVLIQACC